MKQTLLTITLCLALANFAAAADEKINPQEFICAEFALTGLDVNPPLYEGLQLDGYASGLENNPVADSAAFEKTLVQLYDICAARPAEKALANWRELRKKANIATDGAWRADKTTCADYFANEDDGSGFIIWLDGYQRAKTGKDASILTDQKTFDGFMAACKANPHGLIYDVMVEKAR